MGKKSVIDVSTVEVPQALYPRASAPTEKDVEHLRGQSAAFPPIAVAEVDGRIVLVDGAHRIAAATLDEVAELPAERLGKMTEAEVLGEAIRRNAVHGKQLSMADKRKLAKHYASEGWKPKEIRGLLAVGERTMSRWIDEEKKAAAVTAWKKAEKLIEKGCSVSGAAREVGVPRSTLTGWQKNPPKPATGPKTAPATGEVAHNPKRAAKSVGEQRIDSLVEIVTGFAKDAANELAATAADGEDYPHWTEIAEAAIASIRKAYPKGWKVSQ